MQISLRLIYEEYGTHPKRSPRHATDSGSGSPSIVAHFRRGGHNLRGGRSAYYRARASAAFKAYRREAVGNNHFRYQFAPHPITCVSNLGWITSLRL